MPFPSTRRTATTFDGDLYTYCAPPDCIARDQRISVKGYDAGRDGTPRCALCRRPMRVRRTVPTP